MNTIWLIFRLISPNFNNAYLGMSDHGQFFLDTVHYFLAHKIGLRCKVQICGLFLFSLKILCASSFLKTNCLIFYDSKNLNCIGALSFYDSKRSIN